MSEQKEKNRPRRAAEKKTLFSRKQAAPEAAAEPVQAAAPEKEKTTKQSENKEKKGGSRLVPVLIVLALLFGGYSGLCAWVDTTLVPPKTIVNDVDISGVTEEAAAAMLEHDYEARYGNMELAVAAGGQDFVVAVSDSLGLDCAGLAKEAIAPVQGSFFTRGYQLAKAKLMGSQRTVLPLVEDADKLHNAIADSGLLELDTTIQTEYKIKNGNLVFTKGITGQTVDEASLAQVINETIAAGDYNTVLDCPMNDGKVNDVDWEALRGKVCKEMVNATLDPANNYAIVPSVTGCSFSTEDAQKALAQAEEGAKVSVELTYVEPEITTEDMEKNLFKDKLATFTTAVSGTAARVSNVSRAANSINGIIMLHGDSFGYNETLGERTAANGYQPAPAYLNGQTVQEYGGGICQVSSTLYASTLYANLQIDERHNHTYASSYIGLGMDATVSWGGPDFKFTNNKSYPIKIVAAYSGGYVTVTIMGTKTDDTYVEMVSETQETLYFKTEYRQDSSKYKDESYISQKGSNGYKVQTYRQVYQGNGTRISNEKEAYSVYSPHTQIVYNGTKERPVIPAEPEKPADGETPDPANGGEPATPPAGQ